MKTGLLGSGMIWHRKTPLLLQFPQWYRHYELGILMRTPQRHLPVLSIGHAICLWMCVFVLQALRPASLWPSGWPGSRGGYRQSSTKSRQGETRNRGNCESLTLVQLATDVCRVWINIDLNFGIYFLRATNFFHEAYSMTPTSTYL